MILRIGTRGSKLALAQSQWVKDKIEKRYPKAQVSLIRIKTTGDKILDSPLSKIGGKGLFVKEIEEALLENRVDIAVHSMKDVPAELPDALMLSTFPEREDPRDALISLNNVPIHQLPMGANVGTSSLRRSAQLLHIRPDLKLTALRGNVDTRLKKLDSGDLEAIILATAGLNRLGLDHRISQVIDSEQILPAVGQGAIGLEIRRGDAQTLSTIDFLNHKPTQIRVTTERAFLKKLEGGCQVPIAGFAVLVGEVVYFKGMVAELDGTRIIKDEISGEKEQAEALGITLAEKLLRSGADKILENVYGAV